MKLATTTGDFARHLPCHKERIKHVAKAGFKYVDFSFYGDAKEDSVFLQDGWKDYVSELKALADSLGVKFVQAHSPGGNYLCDDEQHRKILVDSTIRSIEVCELLGIKNTVVHAGCAKGLSKKEFFRRNLEFYSLLYPAMEKCNVNVLTENSAHVNMPDMYYFFNGKDIREFVDYANHPNLGICWDTGHANIEGGQYCDIMALGDKLFAVHINDNRGKRDEHVMPFLGTVNMDEVMCALREVGYKGTFTFECDSTMRPAKYWLGDRRTYVSQSRLANPPLELVDEAEQMLYKTGVYILKAYDMFEE